MTAETERMPNQCSFRSAASEDQIVSKQWRLGFFIFYGAMASLLGGLAMVSDRPGTFISAAAPTNPTIASTDTMQRLDEGRARE
jgi:hypothetical protein